MTVCHNNKCYCEIFLAYTRECERLGVELSNWQRQTGCDPSNFKRNKHKKMLQLHRSHRQKMSRKDDLFRMMTTSNFNSFNNITKTRIPIQFSLPPPPIPIEQRKICISSKCLSHSQSCSVFNIFLLPDYLLLKQGVFLISLK